MNGQRARKIRRIATANQMYFDRSGKSLARRIRKNLNNAKHDFLPTGIEDQVGRS